MSANHHHCYKRADGADLILLYSLISVIGVHAHLTQTAPPWGQPGRRVRDLGFLCFLEFGFHLHDFQNNIVSP